MTNPVTYRGWNVHFDNPPIPLRSMDWSATSPDYDVECDDGVFVCTAGQQVRATTYDDLVKGIDAAIDEMDGAPQYSVWADQRLAEAYDLVAEVVGAHAIAEDKLTEIAGLLTEIHKADALLAAILRDRTTT